jgi:hypothetical protein
MKSTKPEPFRSRWRQDIALYRGDELIDSGTIKEIAERRGVAKTRYGGTLRAQGVGGLTAVKINLKL